MVCIVCFFNVSFIDKVLKYNSLIYRGYIEDNKDWYRLSKENEMEI